MLRGTAPRAGPGERVGPSCVPPGQPWHDGYVESFNSRIHDECLNINDEDRSLPLLRYRDREEPAVIARIWRGAVRPEDGDEYAQYIRDTGLSEYRQTPGNKGAWMLRRDVDGRTEFLTLTFWESLDAVKAFAGEDFEVAVYYPKDERYLVERDDTCAHYEVEDGPARQM
jgi:heme-degrading monooxygenase HmoA